jgi:hypothetical protein
MKLWGYDLHLNAENHREFSIQMQIIKDLGNMDFSPSFGKAEISYQ